MRSAAVVLAALLALPSAAQPDTRVAVSFSAPAQAEGGIEVDRLGWALLTFDGAPAQVHLSFAGPVRSTNTTVALLRTRLLGGGEDQAPFPSSESRVVGPVEVGLRFGGQPASLLLHAASIQLQASGVAAAFRPVGDREVLGRGWMATGQAYSFRGGDQVEPGTVALKGPAKGVSLEIGGLQSAEWHNATATCWSGDCPAGAGWTRTRQDLPAGDSVSLERFSYARLEGVGGSGRGSADSLFLLGGGPRFDASLNGLLRLPLARLEEPCSNCLDPGDRTLSLDGKMELSGVEPAPGGRLRVGMDGNALLARLDESSVAWPVQAQAATAVAALALLAALVKAILVLASRMDPAFLLRQPRRRRIHAAVCASPGISLNELARVVGLARGTVQRHVGLLAQGGFLAVQRDGNRLHLFENHNRYDRVWREQAALRDTHLRVLHAWLLAASGTLQVEILSHAEREWGWSRATAHRRLKRLERQGLVAWERSTGRKRYRAVVRGVPGSPENSPA